MQFKSILFLKIFLILIFNAKLLSAQDFQGKAYYFSKSKMSLGRWGARMSEAQKKQVKNRLKNRLEKTYILDFNSTESLFVEEEKVDAISGATDTWGTNFSRGKQYKNILENKISKQTVYNNINDKLFFKSSLSLSIFLPIKAYFLES